ncbi:short-chain dehydrogenase/reductase (SDR) family protein [Tieghemostelium lacteum]|uniref:Short-chain dehydrogenase/reductase (SDR) family protein n=1 Tax=Tieghemostelium lacteum TaxID=361077 RepID=A0A152A7V6_TIELA|nr:short-chain dehydrogenase/reductase (SDR) family protein [Tieghemostelium lacteum]|eukprot:KYR02211.1 short-chain dehydrogenase/reductase (SDR) family protein [Tieghemostelium lacteum]
MISQTDESKVFFITGATSGLGLAVAEKALSLGYKVAGTSRTLDKFKQTKLSSFGKNFLPLQTDLVDEKILGEAVKKTVETFGTIHYVVNNAGYAIGGAVEELSDEDWKNNFQVNYFSPMNVLRATLPILRAQRSGHVFNIASIVGFSRFDCGSAYNATKWALVGLSNTLASEMKPFNVKVTAVCPGTFKTAILNDFPFAKHVVTEYDSKGFLQKWLDRRPTKPLGDPEIYADIFIHFTKVEDPPVHLFIGPDAIHIAQLQIDIMQKEVDSYKTQVVNTDLKE